MKDIPRHITDALIKAFTDYVKAAGWKPIVFGGTYIRQVPGGPYHFEFVIRFTGRRVEDDAPFDC